MRQKARQNSYKCKGKNSVAGSIQAVEAKYLQKCTVQTFQRSIPNSPNVKYKHTILTPFLNSAKWLVLYQIRNINYETNMAQFVLAYRTPPIKRRLVTHFGSTIDIRSNVVTLKTRASSVLLAYYIDSTSLYPIVTC